MSVEDQVDCAPRRPFPKMEPADEMEVGDTLSPDESYQSGLVSYFTNVINMSALAGILL